jgi:hypothetical protein
LGLLSGFEGATHSLFERFGGVVGSIEPLTALS